jgi:uncharacterized cupin superfamily protein
VIITKLQKAMGHSFINVSLTYLRSLEIAELKEEDFYGLGYIYSFSIPKKHQTTTKLLLFKTFDIKEYFV